MPLIDEIGDTVQACGDVTFEWKIRDFFSLSDKFGDFYNSPSFSFADSIWHLTLYPNGDIEESQGWVSLFLTRGDSGPPKTVNYTLSIKVPGEVNVEVLNKKRLFSKNDEGYGRHEFLSRSDLSDRSSILMPNNVLTVTCFLRSNSFSTVKDTPPASIDQAVQAVVVGEENVLKSLRTLLESGDDSDVVITVRGKEFPAHRAILRARSPVFRSMFAHEMVEKNSGVVKIEDCDPDTFHDFLVHIYLGGCEQINTENACSLYTNADKYDVAELKEACSEFLKRNITVECFCDVITLAVKHNEKDLIECATNFFCNRSIDIAKTTAWQTFMVENPTVANELFIKAMSNSIAVLNVSKN